MSGHSKWSTIKHQKGAADAKRGKIFTKLGHAITVAARQGGGDPNMNPRLALAVEMAKRNNMPKENVERAIKRGTGELGGAAAEDVTYEGYGPGGTAIFIEAVTDNRNRTSGEIRAAFNKHAGKLGESGSVAYLFKLRGIVTIEGVTDRETAELAIIESGADDYETTEDGFILYTDPKDLQSVKQAIESAALTVSGAEQRFEPMQTVLISDLKVAQQILRLMEAIEEIDDVSNVTSNFDLDDSIADQLN